MSRLRSAAVSASAFAAVATLMGCSTYHSLPGDSIAQTKLGETTVCSAFAYLPLLALPLM